MTSPKARIYRRHSRLVPIAATLIAALTLIVATTSVSVPVGASTTTTSPMPTITAPTTHSYDDSHTKEQAPGSSLAFWILGAAVICLAVIAAVMLWAGRPPRTKLSRRTRA